LKISADGGATEKARFRLFAALRQKSDERNVQLRMMNDEA